METLTPADTASTSTGPKLIEEPVLDFLLRQDNGAWRPSGNAVVGSIGFHIVVLIALLAVRTAPLAPRPPERYLVRHVTPLYIPPELTQKAPNKDKVKKELALETIAPRPAVKTPAPAAAPKQIATTKPLPMPPAPTPQPPPKQIAAVEPPKFEAPPAPVPQTTLTQTSPLPPAPGSGQQPKISLEDVAPRQAPQGQPTGRIAVPKGGVDEAVRALNRPGAGPISVGSEITFDQGGSGPGLNLPPSLGHAQGGIQLLTNPEGVDFRPYLIQVMAAIRRNWFAVYPEAAKTGMRGEVIVQFRVARQGLVAKVVFNGQSQSRPLNEAAVSAISASNPFPPLPTDFKGDHVDLQMRFLYNMQR